jgi:hypothetical protein
MEKGWVLYETPTVPDSWRAGSDELGEYYAGKRIKRNVKAVPHKFAVIGTGITENSAFRFKAIALSDVADAVASGRKTSIVIPIGELEATVIKQDSLYQLFHNLKYGEFEESFPDLAVAARDEFDLPLEDVKTFVHDEASKGPEVFEAFGMKFPAGQITLWGDIVLLSVQLYLLIYLRRLYGKLRADDPGWDVPWVGMDSSLVSKIVLFISLIVFPVLASTALAVRFATGPASHGMAESISAILSGNHRDHIARTLKLVTMGIAPFISIILGRMCWQYRPQVAQEPQRLFSPPFDYID